MGALGTTKPATLKISRVTLTARAYWGNCQMMEATRTTAPQDKARAG